MTGYAQAMKIKSIPPVRKVLRHVVPNDLSANTDMLTTPLAPIPPMKPIRMFEIPCPKRTKNPGPSVSSNRLTTLSATAVSTNWVAKRAHPYPVTIFQVSHDASDGRVYSESNTVVQGYFTCPDKRGTMR